MVATTYQVDRAVFFLKFDAVFIPPSSRSEAVKCVVDLRNESRAIVLTREFNFIGVIEQCI